MHRIDLFANDTSTGVASLVASRTINTNLAPTGWIDSFTGTHLSGWAFDPNAGAASIQIRYGIDGYAPILATASTPRPDLTANAAIGSPNHGFSITLPQLTVGTHAVTMYAVDPVSDAMISLGTRSATIPNPIASGGNALPIGSFDAASTTSIAGWAQDPTRPTASINVRVDIDGVMGTPFLADKVRKDLTAVLGSSNHAYSEALSLSLGEHRIDIYAINDDVANTPVLIGSRIAMPVAVAGLPSPTGWIDVLTQATISGWVAGTSVPGHSLIRVDVAGVAGAAFNTTIARPDLPAGYLAGGNTFGFNASIPGLAPGSHTVTLVYLDPLTLSVTSIMSRSFVAA